MVPGGDKNEKEISFNITSYYLFYFHIFYFNDDGTSTLQVMKIDNGSVPAVEVSKEV